MPETYVKVRPGAESFKVEMKTYPLIYLENEAENGRANKELLDRIQRITGERPAIISGHKSRRKKLKIQQTVEEFKKELKNNG
ncbi:MAG: DUF167 family protein [Candidatus Nanohalobium sp.]